MAMASFPSGLFVVAAGSVFSQILVWQPLASNQVLYTLQGHEGSILSLRWASETVLISSSDDRSVRVWQGIEHTENARIYAADALSNYLKPDMTIYGHTGRVWDCQPFSYRGHAFIASASEDLKVGLWDMTNGECIAKLEGIVKFLIFLC
jgi:WD40 repeat protein